MPVKLNGATSGSVTLIAPAVAGTNTLTLPAVTDTLVGLAATQTLTGKTLTSPTITGAVVSSMGSSVLTSETAQASTSGTSINFTSIPSWVKRITVMFSGVSTNGSSDIIIQLGTGATPTYTTSGYLGAVFVQSGTIENFTSGYKVVNSNAAVSVWHGSIIINNITSNTWSELAVLGNSNATGSRTSGGSIPLAAALTAVRITTSNGTDTFDAGTINIMYE